MRDAMPPAWPHLAHCTPRIGTMTEPFVSSNPHAFLRPIYRQLAADRTFHLLAEPNQYDRLVAAVAEVSGRHAALMRDYTMPGSLVRSSARCFNCHLDGFIALDAMISQT